VELETETIHDDMKGKDGDEDVHQAQMLLDHHEDMVGNWPQTPQTRPTDSRPILVVLTKHLEATTVVPGTTSTTVSHVVAKTIPVEPTKGRYDGTQIPVRY
jgi:hypothetical protein